jgi:hypothetical protein
MFTIPLLRLGAKPVEAHRVDLAVPRSAARWVMDGRN